MVATRASVAGIEENPDFEAGVSDAEAPEYYPEFAAFGGRPPTRCPGHLTELEPDREIIRLAANDGREMVSLEEYEYLTEYEIPSGISLEDVETQVFPLPEVGGDKADLLKEFSDERSRTLVSVPAGFLDVLRSAKARDDLRAEGGGRRRPRCRGPRYRAAAVYVGASRRQLYQRQPYLERRLLPRRAHDRR